MFRSFSKHFSQNILPNAFVGQTREKLLPGCLLVASNWCILPKDLCLSRPYCDSANRPGTQGLNLNATSPSWIHHLHDEGYAVTPSVLTREECNEIINHAWAWLAKLGTGIRRDDPRTWTDDRWPVNFNGIVQRYRIGHAPFIWQTRSNTNIINVFKEIWGTEELLCSFDAMCLLRPMELVPGMEPKESPYWFHTDQSPRKKGFHCVQGVLNLEDVTADDASFVCYPKSHKLHQELFHRNNLDPEIDYYRLTEDEVSWLEQEKGLVHVKVTPPKGSFVVFDSRQLHCNGPPKYPRVLPRWRYALYVCMTPRAWADRRTVQGRVDAFKKQRMTTHWPHHLGLFPEDPSDVDVPVNKIELTDTIKRLVGMQDYNGRDEVFENDGNDTGTWHDRPAL